MDAFKYLGAVVATILSLFGAYNYGYVAGANEAVANAREEKLRAIAIQVAIEEKKQHELEEHVRSLTTDNERLNRMLKSCPTEPATLQACLRERDGLRKLALEGAELVVEARRGLGWCAIQGKE